MTRKRRLMKNCHKSKSKSRRNIGRGGAKIEPLGVSAAKKPSKWSRIFSKKVSIKKPTPSSKWECSCNYAEESEDEISVASVESVEYTNRNLPPPPVQHEQQRTVAGVAAAVASSMRNSNLPFRRTALKYVQQPQPQPQSPIARQPQPPTTRPTGPFRKRRYLTVSHETNWGGSIAGRNNQDGGANDDKEITKNVICSCKKRAVTASN